MNKKSTKSNEKIEQPDTVSNQFAIKLTKSDQELLRKLDMEHQEKMKKLVEEKNKMEKKVVEKEREVPAGSSGSTVKATPNPKAKLKVLI